MLLTYPFFSVDISSVLYEQPHNISVTIPYSHNEWSALLNIERKYRNILGTFFFCNEKPHEMRLNLLLGRLHFSNIFLALGPK